MTEATPRPLWRRLLSAPFVLLAALILALEEWLWDPLKRAMAWVGSLPVLRGFERWIRSLPPWGAFCLFALPSLVLLPAKLVGLHFLASGQRTVGLLVFFGAKVVGTAIVGRLFTLTEATLRTLPWFARALDGFLALKRRVFAAVWEHPMVLRARALGLGVRVRLRALRLRVVGMIRGGG